MDKDDQKLLAASVMFGIVFLVLMAFPHCTASRAGAQDDDAISALTPPIALGRTAVREAGIAAYRRDDTPAIHAVLSFRAEHIYASDYMTALRRFTRNASVRPELRRPWITQLMPDMRRPPLWPGHLRWEGSGARHWRRTLRHARDVLRGDVEHSCRRPGTGVDDVYATPHDWGSAQDAIVFRRNNPDAVELDCGQTCWLRPDGSVRRSRDGLAQCNHFFSLPRYEARFGEI